jgi:hypothetical protein
LKGRADASDCLGHFFLLFFFRLAYGIYNQE